MNKIIFSLLFLLSVSCSKNDYCSNLIKAENHEIKSEYKKAIKIWESMESQFPNDQYVLLNKAIDNYFLDNYRESLKDLNSYLMSEPHSEMGLFYRALIYKELKLNKNALNDLLKLEYLKRGEGVELNISKNYKNEYECQRKDEIELNDVLYEKALNSINLGYLNEALMTLNELIKKNYDLKNTLYWRGIILISLNQKSQGCNDISEAIKLGQEVDYELKKMCSTN